MKLGEKGSLPLLLQDPLISETCPLEESFGGNTPLGGTLTGGAGNSYYAFVNRPRNIALQINYSF